MISGNFGMFENDNIHKSIDAMAANSLVFNPFLIWGAGVAVGIGALAGLNRAASERIMMSGRVSVMANGYGSPFDAGSSSGSAGKVSLNDTPVEALSRPILNEMMEQAIIEQKTVPSKARKPKAKTARTGPKRPSGLENPRAGKADDLKSISGIGPKLELTLNDLGIYHFDQIAAWTKAETDWIDDYLSFRGRVERDRWIEQAGELSN